MQRKDYAIGLNTTGVGVDDPDVNLVENYTCKSDRNYTGYCNEEVDKLIFAQSREIDPEKRRQILWEAERKIAADVARPIILHNRAATCWQPSREGRHQPQQLALQQLAHGECLARQVGAGSAARPRERAGSSTIVSTRPCRRRSLISGARSASSNFSSESCGFGLWARATRSTSL